MIWELVIGIGIVFFIVGFITKGINIDNNKERSRWVPAITFCVVGVLMSIFILSPVIESQNMEVDEKLKVSFGIIEDFEVSAGGFMSSDKCTVEFNDGKKETFSGELCKNLSKGKTIVSKERMGVMFGSKWIYYEVE